MEESKNQCCFFEKTGGGTDTYLACLNWAQEESRLKLENPGKEWTRTKGKK